jgi:outer membrane autotransporter protein
MKRTSHCLAWVALALMIHFFPGSAHSQPAASCSPSTGVTAAAGPQACLTTLVETLTSSKIFQFDGLELAAAQADDAAFESLLKGCVATASCKGTQLNLYNRLLELEENASQLLGFGPTTFSLNLSAQGVADALRWTADEEFAAQSSMTSRFAGNQFSAVSNRLTALRFLQAVRLARQDGETGNGLLADATSDGSVAWGGGASGDPQSSSQFGRWSVFANSSYGAGTKAPTVFDDAFSFGGTQVSLGADVRLSSHAVVGLLINHVNQEADFNSSESVVGGGITSSGYGVTSYLQLDWDAAYLNFSLGGQRVSLDSTRLVAYPSNNPLVPSVDTTFQSSTYANSLLLTAGGGYMLHTRGFSAEPYLNLQYLYTRIDAFTETASSTDNTGFATSVSSQGVTSLQGILGLKLQYVWQPKFAVILPYVYGEYRHEFRNPSQDVSSEFGAAPAGNYFQLPTDALNASFYQVGAGLSAVLPHGAQLYFQYMRVLSLQYYTDWVASGGFRFEF